MKSQQIPIAKYFGPWKFFMERLPVSSRTFFSKWVKPEKFTVKGISEMLILEQILRMVHPELEVWISEHDPVLQRKQLSWLKSSHQPEKGPSMPSLT